MIFYVGDRSDYTVPLKAQPVSMWSHCFSPFGQETPAWSLTTNATHLLRYTCAKDVSTRKRAAVRPHFQQRRKPPRQILRQQLWCELILLQGTVYDCVVEFLTIAHTPRGTFESS